MFQRRTASLALAGTTFIEVLLEEAVRRQELNEPVSRRADGHHSLGGQHGHIGDGAIHPLLAASFARNEMAELLTADIIRAVINTLLGVR